MSFTAPGLLLLLAVLLPGIVVLHTLRREEHATASLFLWSKVTSRRQGTQSRRSVPWSSPLLWLHLAIATLGVLALAGPFVGDPPADHLIVVLDGSRTMRTADVAPDRFGAAVDWAMDAIDAYDASTRVSVVIVSDTAHVAALRTRPGAELRQRLRTASADDTTPAWTDALVLAAGLARPNETTRTWIATDAAGEVSVDAALTGLDRSSTLDVERFLFGGPFVNVGVDAVEVQPRGTVANRWTVTGELRSVGLQRGDVVRVQVLFRPDGSDTSLPWSGVDVELGRDGSGAFELPIDLPGDGLLEIRSGGLDQRAADDVAWRVLRSDAARAQVALVGPEDPALLAALRAVGDLQLFAFEDVPAPDVARRYDLVIVTRPTALPVATSVLWYGVPPPAFVAGAQADVDDPTSAAPGHPLMRDVDPREMGIDRARALDVPGGAQALITSGGDVLAWSRTTDVGRQVALGFGPGDSAWASQLSFPVFFASLLDWSRSRPAGAVQVCGVGPPCGLPREAFAGGWTVVDDDDETVATAPTLATVDDGHALQVWPPGLFERSFAPKQAGRFEITYADGTSTWLAVDAGAPDEDPPVDAADGASATLTPDAPTVPVALWRWLAAAATVLLAVDAFYVARSLRTSLSARSTSGRRPLLWTGGLLVVAAGLGVAAVFQVPTLRLPAQATRVIVQPAASPRAEGTAVAERLWARLLGWRTEAVSVGGAIGDVSETRGSERVPTLEAAADRALALSSGTDAIVMDARSVPVREIPAADLADLFRRSTSEAADVVLWTEAPDATEAASSAPTSPFQRVRVPVPPRSGGAFDVEVTLEPMDAPTRIDVVDADGAVVASQEVDPGARAASVSMQAGASGWSGYTLRLAPSGGQVGSAILGEAAFVVNVGAPLSVLFVASDDEDGALLAAALEAQQIDVTRAEPARLPATLDRMAAHDVVLLADVPAGEIHPIHQEMLLAFARDRGGGVVIAGGARSFGPGGYYSTPLDEVSPLSSRIQEDSPEVAMTFVMDRSGSMEAIEGDATRLDLAKLATFEAIRLLGERSQAALVAFDTVATTLLPLRSTAELAPFRDALQSIVPGGGTSIYPALVEAYDIVAASDAATRHVIVLTDGLSEEGDFEEVLGRIRGLGVNTSFVGIGDAASRGQLNRLVGYGGGSLHFTRNARALPGILAQEALLLSADPVEERRAPSAWVGGSPPAFLGEAVASSPPTFLGYIQTTPKDEATVVLEETVSGEPLLATWRYGLGRVAAFTTEADGPWSGTWTQQDDFAPFWSQLVRWSASTVPSGPFRLDVAVHEAVADVALDVAPDADLAAAPVAQLVDAASDVVVAQAAMRPDRGGRWYARLGLPAPDAATYVVRVSPGSDADDALEHAFVHADTSWHDASPIDVVSTEALRATLAQSAADGGRVASPRGRLTFLLPGVAWTGPPSDGWAAAVLAFMLALLVRFGVLRRTRPGRSASR